MNSQLPRADRLRGASDKGGRSMLQDTRPLVDGKYLHYMDKPLVREGDTICYGDMSEKCILILEIMSYKKSGANDIPDKILIQIMILCNICTPLGNIRRQ